jgi:hypothetical protein
LKLILKIFLLCLLTDIILAQPSITWNRYYADPNNLDQTGFGICKTIDNNYVIGGSAGFINAMYVKFDDYGNVLWEKFFQAGGLCLASTRDGGIISAWSELLKLNSQGDSVWHKIYPGQGIWNLYDITQCIDGGYIACGRAYADSGYVLKTDSLGNFKWSHIVSDPTRKVHFLAINQINANFYLAVGGLHSFYDTSKIIAFKLDSNGNKVWKNEYSVINVGWRGIGIINLQSYIIIVSTNGYIKIDQNGSLLQQKLMHLEQNESILDMKNYNNNKFAACTYTTMEPYIARLKIIDTAGIILFSKELSFMDYIKMRKVLPLNNGDIIFSGDAEIDSSQSNYYVIRADSTLNYPPIGISKYSEKLPNNFFLYQNYPNPFNPSTKIKFDIPKDANVSFKIYDILGKEVYSSSEFKKAGTYEFTFDGNGLASGIYFYKLETDKFVESRKMILIK